jgi:glutamate N-acetyltransferase/amino-acid N-acetyltransferase
MDADFKKIDNIKLSTTCAGLKKKKRHDLLLIIFPRNSTVSAVFTKNKLAAAPVLVAKRNLLSKKKSCAIIVNSSIANAGTGQKGLEDVNFYISHLAKKIDCDPQQILPFSTGVIMEYLPLKKMVAGINHLLENLSYTNWDNASRAIMTTDTKNKIVRQRVIIDGKELKVIGISKGSGMIAPNMATMLSFIFTNASISKKLQKIIINDSVKKSFNNISVDGDTSTNDSYVLVSTPSEKSILVKNEDDKNFHILKHLIMDVSKTLAKKIVKDGEGATKFLKLIVSGVANKKHCKIIASKICNSPLVKTALNASDPNIGRIYSALGSTELSFIRKDNFILQVNDLVIWNRGKIDLAYTEKKGQYEFKKKNIIIRVSFIDKDSFAEAYEFYSCDLSKEYVEINSNYRT